MLTERPLHADIKSMLLSNQPFQYAHLIKFERPSRPDSNSGQVSTSKERYTYLTDASRDVDFDDGSVNQSGAANGTQTYVANKVLKVSSVQEDTEAKATAYSLTLDGNGLGAIANGAATITLVDATTADITFPTNVNLISLGFRELDKVMLTGPLVGAFNISRFLLQNKVRVTQIDTAPVATTGTVTMSLSSDEIVSILLDKNASNYSSFINREVYIYRGYFVNGTVVGTPFLLFKGIISGVNFDDDDTSLTVTWTMTSHWGDFSQVTGRITSDDFHRALDQNGIPQPGSAVKTIYAYDKGFSHAETSINILAQYSVQVEKQDVTVKKGFLGIGSKVKVKKYFVNESRNSELDFQLQAKAIPVIYGVRNTTGIPVFADTLNSDSSTVYVAQALSEGEIGGIYDVYIEGNSLICNDKADFDARSTQTTDETVKLICRGRADRGDVLGGVASVSTVTVNPFYDFYYSNPTLAYKMFSDYDFNSLYYYADYVEPATTNTDTSGAGIVDGQSINLSSPQEITIDVFSGKPGQKAASSLVSIAKSNNFKIQNSYWNGINTADYWGPNHRLLDTAYVVCKFKITEGETTIPSLEFIVRGKTVDCYNYDKSYSHDRLVTGESADNFNLGDTVTLKDASNTIIAPTVQIVDKWKITRADGVVETRFRFSIDPPLNYINGVPGITKFKMVNGSSQEWTMITYNYRQIDTTVYSALIVPITGAVNSGSYVQFQYGSNGYMVGGGDPIESSAIFSVVNNDGTPVNNNYFGNSVLVGTATSTSLTTKYAWSAAGPAATQAIAKYLLSRNSVILDAAASSTNDFYNGYQITLTKINPTTGKKVVQTKKIIDYVGTTRVAVIDGLWDYGMHPVAGDAISITPSYADSRISINPAIQLMDYISSPAYGRGLDVRKDLNFQSWLDTAKKCDTQSDVTVQSTGGTMPTIGDVYRYPASGTLLWQGKVGSTSTPYVQFGSVLGKLTNAWNNWKNYTLNQLVYADANLYLVTTAGVKTVKPTHTSGTVSGLQYLSSVNLTKVSGSGPSTIGLMVDGNPIRALSNGSTIPGYSLYDSDGVDYWRMLGWESPDQRYVTRHQTNITIDTSLPLFDNVNSFLEHFGGIMRYSGGQYYLELEEAEGGISNADNEARNITSDHIIGKIRLTDDGIKSAFNSLTAAYADPANKYESRNISFFNSEYLKADRGVPKKGTLTVPGITNYYNTRILANKFLNKSRYGLNIAFNMAPRGTLLLAGQVIQLNYPRYNWVDKKFRITTLTHQTDATVDVIAEEYDDSFYNLSRLSKQPGSGIAGNTGGTISSIGAPTNLHTTSVDTGDETYSGVNVTWNNSPDANTDNVSTEIYSSYSDQMYIFIDSITSNVITTTTNHNLKVGEQITGLATMNNIVLDQTYFVRSTPTANTLTLSDTKGGSIKGLTNGSSSLGIPLQTSSLIATVPVPASSFIDVFGGSNNRIVKYYWIRHKVVQV